MMKIRFLLLLCSVSGLWFPVQHGHCSEQTHTHTPSTGVVSQHHDTHSDQWTSHEPMIAGNDEQSVFISEVESSSVSSQIPDFGPASPHECVSCRDSGSGVTDLSGAACDAAGYDPGLSSFPAVQENVSVRESRRPAKGRRTNASRVLKDQGPADSDPSMPCRDQEIPTFEEWTKIMLEVENEKTQVTHPSEGFQATGKKLQQTVTNYASVECGAKILSSNPEAKSTSAILMENMDMYMLNPCNNKIWFIIELCQPIQIKQLDIANFEIFSSNPKDFLVSISDRYPNKKWVKLGTFHARDERAVQSFPLDEHLFAKYIKIFTKYIKVELLSHFGSEHFCPLSLIRVYGTSMMEEYEMNSDPSDRAPQVQDEQDSDQSPGFVSVDDKVSQNLIGSAKDALLTMVNNIAANVLGGAPESTAGAGNSSAAGLNMTELLFPAETIQSAASSGLKTVIRITETTSITEEMTVSLSDTAGDPRVQTRPDVERIVTLLPEEEPDQSSEGLLEPGADRQERSESACSCSHRDSLQEYLLQRCSSPDLLQKTPSTASVTQEPQSPSLSPDIEDLAPSLTSDVLLLVSADSSRAATRPIELMCASASECLSETLPQQSADHLTESSQKPDLTSTSAARSEEDQISLDHHIPAPTVSLNSAESSKSAIMDEAVSRRSLTPAQDAHPSEGLSDSESRNKELLDDESNAHIEQIYTEVPNSSDAPAHGSNQKESVFMRLNNRIKVLEMNMSLSGRYLEQLSQRYRKQMEEMQRAFNKTIIKLQNTSRMSEEQDQRQTDSIQALQAQLENVTQLVIGLSVSVSRLQQEVSDRQSYILLCLLLCVLLGLLICVNYRQISESPALHSPDREWSDAEAVLLRRRASDPPSLSSLQSLDGASEETSSRKQREDCEKKLSRGPETLFPHSTITPPGLETDSRDVSDGSSEGSSLADETLFCGISSCARLCEALPAPKVWTHQKSRPHQNHHQSGSRRSQNQPPQRSGPRRTGTETGHNRTEPPLRLNQTRPALRLDQNGPDRTGPALRLDQTGQNRL